MNRLGQNLSYRYFLYRDSICFRFCLDQPVPRASLWHPSATGPNTSKTVSAAYVGIVMFDNVMVHQDTLARLVLVLFAKKATLIC